MPCPHHSREDTDESDGGDESNAAGSGLDRRSFVKSALLIGGPGALASLGGCTTTDDGTENDETASRVDAATRLNRQHAWDAFEGTAATGNTVQPATSVFLMLDYLGEGPPTPAHREQVETALREIEHHFRWSADGVLFTMAYSAAYFDRFERDPPPGADPMPASEVVETAAEITPYDPEPDSYDAFLLLSSEHAAKTLAAEEALWGNGDLDFAATFESVFEKPEKWPERRVGFAGPAFQEREAEYEETYLPEGAEVPDEAPLSAGFVAGFDASIPEEEAVTLERGQRFPGPEVPAESVPTDEHYVGEVGTRDPGVFAQGTLKHLSYLTLDLGGVSESTGWYELDEDRRRAQMYSPYHTREETNGKGGDKPGSGLTDDPGGDPGAETGNDGMAVKDLLARKADSDDYASRTVETAERGTALTDGTPTTGHSQKAARARYDVDGDGELEQPCLRRDWDGVRPPEDGYEERAGYHFNVPMRFEESIFTLLDANYSVGFRSLDGRIDHEETGGEASLRGGDTSGERNGLVPFMNATRRSNWLVPPITLRALPHPRADEARIESVECDDGEYRVTVTDLAGESDGAGALDPDTVRFGAAEDVNQALGAALAESDGDGDEVVFRFPTEGAGITVETDRVKLFGKRRETRKPVVAETDVEFPLAVE